MQRVVGLCKAKEPSPPGSPGRPTRGSGEVSAPVPPSRPAPVPFNFCWMA